MLSSVNVILKRNWKQNVTGKKSMICYDMDKMNFTNVVNGFKNNLDSGYS